MDEAFYRQAMSKAGIKPNAIDTRVYKARKAEEILAESFDTIVMSDDSMYDSLLVLKQHENPQKAPLSNALRKYYFYKNNRDFPRLKDYSR